MRKTLLFLIAVSLLTGCASGYYLREDFNLWLGSVTNLPAERTILVFPFRVSSLGKEKVGPLRVAERFGSPYFVSIQYTTPHLSDKLILTQIDKVLGGTTNVLFTNPDQKPFVTPPHCVGYLAYELMLAAEWSPLEQGEFQFQYKLTADKFSTSFVQRITYHTHVEEKIWER